MAKRDNKSTQANRGTTTADAMDQRVLAFAERLGRIAGTLQAKAEWRLDRQALTRQIASVRDSASELLEQLAGDATKGSKTTRPPGRRSEDTKGRSGGVVDAPGKKHRKLVRADPRGNLEDSQAAKMRMARTMIKTNRRRGRG